MSYAEFEQEQITALDKMLEQAKNAVVSSAPAPANAVLCHACGKPMRRIKRKDGKYFWGCAGFPNCRTTADDVKGKPKFKTK